MKRSSYDAAPTRLIVFLVLAGLLTLGGAAMIGLPLLLPDIMPPLQNMVYASFAPFGVAVILFIAAMINFGIMRHRQRLAREEFLTDLGKASRGEKAFLDEDSDLYGKAAKAFNDSTLLQRYESKPFGTYDAKEFDATILETLGNEVSVKAGVALFLFDNDEEIAQGPRQALLDMLKAHFGEAVYYGRLERGFAVFSPVLSSREEFFGKTRRTVQLYSYTDGDLHIAVKAGVAFYPDLAPKNLTTEGLASTLSQDLLSTISKDTEVLHRGYKSSDLDAYMLGLIRFREALSKAKSEEEAKKAYDAFALPSLQYLGADAAGVMIYEDTTHSYELLGEVLGPESKGGFSLLLREGRVNQDLVNPFYEWSLREKGAVLCGDRVFLPVELSNCLDAIGAMSLGALYVASEGKKVGFAYVCSKAKNRFENCHELTSYLYALEDYCLFVERARHKASVNSHEDVILSTFEHYVYAVAKGSFTLSYVSGNLTDVLPEAKVGALCHKALFGRDKPCRNCPIFHDNVETMVPRISSGVFAYRAIPSDKETVLIMSPHQSDFTSSRIDPLTGLLSDGSLHEDMQNEILLKESDGCVLAFRLRNADTLMRMFRLTSIDEPLKIAATALQSASLGRGLYRNGTAGFAYLLPYVQKADAYALAENVTKALSGKFEYEGKPFEFILDFVLVSYPLEAETPIVLDSLLRVLYQRADASGRGRLFEVDREGGRLVDYAFYLKTKMEEGLRAKRVPLRYRVYEELSGNNIAFLSSVIAIADEGGQVAEESFIFGLADEAKKRHELILAEAGSLAKVLGKYRRETSASTLKGAVLPVESSCLNPDFVKAIAKMLDENKASHAHLYLEVNEEDIGEGFDAFMAAAKKAKIRVGLGKYRGDKSAEELKPFAFVSFNAADVYGRDKGTFLLSLSSVRQLGINVLVNDYQDDEERHYLGSLAFHYGNKKGVAPLSEEDVLARING